MISAHNKASKLELRPTVHHQELFMKYEALKKEHKDLKEAEESHSALKKKHKKLKHYFKIKDLNYQAVKRTVTLRESELKDLKEKISKLSKQPTNNNNDIENSDDDEDDEDITFIEYVNKRQNEKENLVATN